MKKKILNVLIVMFAITFVGAGIKLAIEYTQLNKEDAAFTELARQELPFDENKDMAGWLKVDGTYIDYPVMHTPENPEFYLHADFEKNESNSGTPFLDYRCSLNSDNMTIYAHNMQNGTMFSTLSNFEEESFFKEHDLITFETIEGMRKYKVIAAFRSEVHEAVDIYDFHDAKDAAEYDRFVSMIKEKALYDTGLDASYGDQLITLSTCAYHVENGRFIVIGKRVK